MLSVDANGLVKILFTDNIISLETKDLSIVDKSLAVTAMKFDEEKQDFSISVEF